jgi:hypothetical protein
VEENDNPIYERIYEDILQELKEKYPIFHNYAFMVLEEMTKHFPDEADAFSSGGKIREETLNKITNTYCKIEVDRLLWGIKFGKIPSVLEKALMEAARTHLELIREKIMNAMLKADYSRNKLKRKGEYHDQDYTSKAI